jgi:hypothetical protein
VINSQALNDAEAFSAQERRTRLFWRCLVFAVALVILGSDAAGRYSPYRWLYADGSFYYNMVRGLVSHGSLEQGHIHPRTWFNGKLGWNYNLTDDWSNISVGRDGTTWYPKHAFLMPLLSVPFLLAFGPIGTLVFNVLCGALTALLSAELGTRFTRRPAASLIAMAMTGMPSVVRQAYGFNNDVFYSVLVVGTAIYVIDRAVWRAGIVGGFSVLAKITNVLFLMPFALILSFDLPRTRDWRPLLRFAIGCSLGIGIAAIANWIMFGAPWTTAYQRVLIVHDGAQEIQSHFRLFSRDFDTGLAAIWAQLRHNFPAYLLAFAGCLAWAARRKWAEAIAFSLALILPLLFFAKYSWYREEFLDPCYALCVAPLCALPGLFFPPKAEPATAPRLWKWGIASGVAVLAVFALARGAMALVTPANSLYALLPEAEVYLGDVSCDYFNNQVDRWECSGFDRGQEWSFTGRTLDRLPLFGGAPRAMIDLNPNPSGQPRRLLFRPEWGRRLELEYGIPDGVAMGMPVDFTVKLGDREVLHESVDGPGLHHLAIDTRAGSRETLELIVTGTATPQRQFYVNGTLEK